MREQGLQLCATLAPTEPMYYCCMRLGTIINNKKGIFIFLNKLNQCQEQVLK